MKAQVRPTVYALLLSALLAPGLDPAPRARAPSGGKKAIYQQGWIDLNKNGRKDVYEGSRADIARRVEDLLARMTLEEKTCQTATLYGFARVLKDPLPTPEWKNRIWKDGIANIDEHLNGWGAEGSKTPYATDVRRHVWAMNEVQRFFVEETRLGIPADFTDEGIRGVAFHTATSFPAQPGVGSTWDRELVREVGRITGREARALGYTNVYSPILDVARDQRWGRMEEVYGEDPYLVARLGVEQVKGLQENFQVASTPKHFAVYGNNKGAREGDEVVQLYTRDVVSSVTTYEKNLRGFERVPLRPGEARTVSFTLAPEDLALWDRQMKFVVEPGAFRVMIGSSSEDIRLKGEFSIIPEATPREARPSGRPPRGAKPR